MQLLKDTLLRNKLRFSTVMQVDEISGGITNLLWKLTPSLESGLSPVVMRVFGEQTDLLIDREREKAVLLQLNQAGFGAPVRGSWKLISPLSMHAPCRTTVALYPHLRLTEMRTCGVSCMRSASHSILACAWSACHMPRAGTGAGRGRGLPGQAHAGPALG